MNRAGLPSPIIAVLDEATANQIAAGEVVERPASVAKELLENALDAGSSQISVTMDGGGIERLRVVDNGCGMSPADALLCLRRHATSKLRSVADLQQIATLGFRGEALPSIASVSKLRIRTRQPDAIGAFQVYVEGGKPPVVSDAGTPPGTEVLVEDLFFNVPARRKFLKGAETEASHIHEAVVRLAIAHPGVGIRLSRDGRLVLDLPRHDCLLDRLRALFGAVVAERLRPVQSRPGALYLDGYVGAPADAAGTSRHYHLFVNGRFVRDRVVLGAVRAAYQPHVPSPRRHPFVVLRLSVPPEQVDVNVHPAKTEVRFVDNGAVHRKIVAVLDEVLRQSPWDQPVAPDESIRTRTYELDVQEPAPPLPPHAGKNAEASATDAHRRRVFDVLARLGERRGSLGLGRSATEPPAIERGQPARSPLGFADLRPLGVAGPLLVCVARGSVFYLDWSLCQTHLAAATLSQDPRPQPLVEPQRIDLNQTELGRLEQIPFAEVGVEVEPFGGATVALKALPEGLDPVEGAHLLHAALALAEPTPLALIELCARLGIRARLPPTEELAQQALLSALARAGAPLGAPLCGQQSFVELQRLMRG